MRADVWVSRLNHTTGVQNDSLVLSCLVLSCLVEILDNTPMESTGQEILISDILKDAPLNIVFFNFSAKLQCPCRTYSIMHPVPHYDVCYLETALVTRDRHDNGAHKSTAETDINVQFGRSRFCILLSAM